MMTRTFVCFFVLFILSIAIQFGDCENNNPECADKNIIPGSDETNLSKLEKSLKMVIPTKWLQDKETGGDKESGTGSFSKMFEKLKKKFLIFPGTRWCGNGDTARNESDLGFFKSIDVCCRAHDNCPNDILANQTAVNLKNNGIFTKSACTCDTEFYYCLKKANNLFAREIGVTYFNVLGPQCFRCSCPEEDCNREDGTECKNHCKKYEWVDNKKY